MFQGKSMYRKVFILEISELGDVTCVRKHSYLCNRILAKTSDRSSNDNDTKNVSD